MLRPGVNSQYVNALLTMITKTDNVINQRERLFYERTDFSVVLSKFINYKEMFVKKIFRNGREDDYDLVLDLESSKKILWDLLFLAEIVKYETEKQKGDTGLLELKRAITLKRYNDLTPSNDEHVYVEDYANLFDLGEEVVLLDGTILKQKDLFDRLADAICIFDAIRNSSGHNKNGNSILFDFTPTTRSVSIANNSPKNKLDLKIDYDYLADFGYGIRTKAEHASIANKINYYHAALCDVLDISLKDGMEIFYRTDVEVLSGLMDFVKYDYKKLLSLPVVLFYQKFDSKKLNKLLRIVGDVELFKYLPISYFSYKCSKASFNFLIDYLKESSLKGISTKDALIKLKDTVKPSFFLKSDGIFEIVNNLNKIPEVDGYKFSVLDLSEFPSTFTAAGNDWNKVKFLLSFCGNRVSELKKVNKAVFYSSCSNKRLELLLHGCKDLSCLDGLSAKVFHHDCSLSKLKMLLVDNVDGKEDFDRFEYIRKLPVSVFETHCSCNKLNYILTKGGTLSKPDLSLIDELPDCVFSKNSSIERIKKFAGDDWDYSKLKDIPEMAFYSLCYTHTIDGYLDNDISLSLLPNGMFVDYINYRNLKYIFNAEHLKKAEFLKLVTEDKENNDILNKLPLGVFQPYTKFDRVKILMGEERNVSNLFGLSSLFFFNDFDEAKLSLLIKHGYTKYFSDPKYFKLWNRIYVHRLSVDRLKYLLNYVENIDELNQLPSEIFTDSLSDEFLDEIVHLVGFSNLRYLSNHIFRDMNIYYGADGTLFTRFNASSKDNMFSKLKLLVGKVRDLSELSDLPPYYFSADCSYDRFESLYARTGYDLKLLKLLPKELFYCDKEYLDSIFYTNPDLQLCMLKSLFGTSNEGAISLVLLMNGVFNGYENSAALADTVDTSIIDMNESFDSFVAVPHGELSSVITEINELLVDDTKFINYLKNNGLSFDSFCDEFKSFRSKAGNDRVTVDQLITYFNDWNAAYSKIFSEKIPLVNGTIIRCTRNGIGHFKFKLKSDTLDSGKDTVLGIYDSVLTSDSSNRLLEVQSYGGSATLENWFNFTKNIFDGYYLNNSSSLSSDQIIRCVANLAVDGVTYKSLDDLYQALYRKIIAYKEKVISFCIASSYLLENEPTKLVSVAKGRLDLFIQDTAGKTVCNPVSVALAYLRSIGMSDEYVENLVSSRNLR